MSEKSSSLKDAIDKLSSDKKAVSEEALRAKDQLEQLKERARSLNPQKASKKHFDLLEEFDYSVNLLASIFQKSNFDDLVAFIASPSRVIGLNFIIGLIRGFGFAIGVLVILFVISYLVLLSFPATDLAQLFQALVQKAR